MAKDSVKGSSREAAATSATKDGSGAKGNLSLQSRSKERQSRPKKMRTISEEEVTVGELMPISFDEFSSSEEEELGHDKAGRGLTLERNAKGKDPIADAAADIPSATTTNSNCIEQLTPLQKDVYRSFSNWTEQLTPLHMDVYRSLEPQLAQDFLLHAYVHKEVNRRLKDLAEKPGWFISAENFLENYPMASGYSRNEYLNAMENGSNWLVELTPLQRDVYRIFSFWIEQLTPLQMDVYRGLEPQLAQDFLSQAYVDRKVSRWWKDVMEKPRWVPSAENFLQNYPMASGYSSDEYSNATEDGYSGEEYSNATEDGSDEYSREGYPCDECGKTLPTRNGYDGHMRSKVHEKISIRCAGCPRLFRTLSYMIMHLETGNCIFPNRFEIARAIRSWENSDSRFCRSLTTESVPSRPEERMGTASWCYNGSRYSCPKCSKAFSYEHGIDQHLRSPAHDALDYCCFNCNKKYTAFSSLIQHLESESCNAMSYNAVKNMVYHIRKYMKENY